MAHYTLDSLVASSSLRGDEIVPKARKLVEAW